MGHTQCISRSAGTEQILVQRGHCRLDAPGQPLPEPPGPAAVHGQEVVPNSQPEKSHIGVRVLKDRELEPTRVESSEDAKRLQKAMTHLNESGEYTPPALQGAPHTPTTDSLPHKPNGAGHNQRPPFRYIIPKQPIRAGCASGDLTERISGVRSSTHRTKEEPPGRPGGSPTLAPLRYNQPFDL